MKKLILILLLCITLVGCARHAKDGAGEGWYQINCGELGAYRADLDWGYGQTWRGVLESGQTVVFPTSVCVFIKESG